MIRGNKVDGLQRKVKQLRAGGGSDIHQDVIVRVYVLVLIIGTTTNIAVAVYIDVEVHRALGSWSPCW